MKIITKKNVFDFLKNHKVFKNDTLFIHGNAMSIAQVYGENKINKVNNFWEYIKDYIGEHGTIIVPTFTYSAVKNEFFDPLNTPSQVGQFSEDFRKLSYTKRTSHTIFSVSCWGHYQNFFLEASLNTCFGKNSIFDILNQINSKLICIGCSYNELTFAHFVEESFGINYRYLKKFIGEYIDKDIIKNIEVNYFVRKLNYKIPTKLNLEKIIQILKSKNLLIDLPFSRLPAYSCSANDFYKYSFESLKSDEHFFIH